MEKLLKDKTGCMYASTTSSNCDFYDYTTPVKNSCLVSPRLSKLGKRTSETYQSEFFGI